MSRPTIDSAPLADSLFTNLVKEVPRAKASFGPLRDVQESRPKDGSAIRGDRKAFAPVLRLERLAEALIQLVVAAVKLSLLFLIERCHRGGSPHFVDLCGGLRRHGRRGRGLAGLVPLALLLQQEGRADLLAHAVDVCIRTQQVL